MVIVVRPWARVSNAFWTARSVSMSRALVASSSTSTRGSRSRVLAMAQALLLAAGETMPARADHGVVALGQRSNQVVDLGAPGRVLDLGVGASGLA